MAILESTRRIIRVTVYEEEKTRYYNPYFETRWNELKEMLKDFGISFTSEYDVEFFCEKYKLRGCNQPFGARDVYVYYGDVCIAKGYITGSNYCDSEGNLDIYLTKLKSVYVKK